MDWQEAKDGTLRYWYGVRESLDELDEVELLREINAVNDLCDQAKEQSHGEEGRCNACIAFQQFGGCMGISLQMSEAVVDGRKDELRELVDRFISQLESLEVPETADGAPL
jgi:hypothetical protein